MREGLFGCAEIGMDCGGNGERGYGGLRQKKLRERATLLKWGSRLARDVLHGAELIQLKGVIVKDHREQARSHSVIAVSKYLSRSR